MPNRSAASQGAGSARGDPEQLREVVAANIRHLAGQKDLGLNALADLSGVGRTQLYDVLAGRKAATTDWLAKVCVTLGVEPHVLLRPMRDGAATDDVR